VAELGARAGGAAEDLVVEDQPAAIAGTDGEHQ